MHSKLIGWPTRHPKPTALGEDKLSMSFRATQNTEITGLLQPNFYKGIDRVLTTQKHYFNNLSQRMGWNSDCCKINILLINTL